MSKAWPLVPLGDVLRKSNESIDVPPDGEFREITVKLWGKGVIQRGTVSGASLAGTRRFVARTQQFIVSRIDARNGAMGIVPVYLDGALVTNDFPLFDLDSERLDSQFLEWLSKTQDFVYFCQRASEGSTNRVRLIEERFLSLQLSLPPLNEQQRIVSWIAELAAKINEARVLREETDIHLEQLLRAEEMRIWPDEALTDAPTLQDVTLFLARGKQSLQGESRHRLIKTQHVQMGQYRSSSVLLAPEAARKVKPEALVRRSDILIACSAAGCLGRVAVYDVHDDCIASTDTHVAIARANPSVVLPEYLYAYLRGAQGQIQLRSREKGDWMRDKIGFRLTELNMADLRRVPVPTPTLAEQHAIVAELQAVKVRLEAVRHMQQSVAGELDALLPAILDRAFKGEL